jgi:hypothetical protein
LIGITVIEILTQQDPYPGNKQIVSSNSDNLDLDVVMAAAKVSKGYTHPIPSGVHPKLEKLLKYICHGIFSC